MLKKFISYYKPHKKMFFLYLLDAFFILSQFYYFNVKNIHIKKIS